MYHRSDRPALPPHWIKLLIAGDFLLARSSMSLARLRSLESVELMSAAIEHLVKVSELRFGRCCTLTAQYPVVLGRRASLGLV